MAEHLLDVEFVLMLKEAAAKLTSSFIDAPLSVKALLVYGWLHSLVGPILTEKTWIYALLPLSLLLSLLWLLRLRWFWWLMAIGGVLGLITGPIDGQTPWLVASNAISLVLTLWPSTYTFVTRRPLPTWLKIFSSDKQSRQAEPLT